MRVINKGEPTVYFVESNSLECLDQARRVSMGAERYPHLFSRLKHPALRVGGPCPRCQGQLDVRFHTVDIGAYSGNGCCSCEFFQMSPEMQARVSRMSPAEQAMGRCRCSHIKAARDFALDVALRAQAQRENRRVA